MIAAFYIHSKWILSIKITNWYELCKFKYSNIIFHAFAIFSKEPLKDKLQQNKGVNQ